MKYYGCKLQILIHYVKILHNVEKMSFFMGFSVPSCVGRVEIFGEDFFGKSIFGHFFCPIFKTQNTLCQIKS
jgi:hypothetical protein